jgi:hypothetical protein
VRKALLPVPSQPFFEINLTCAWSTELENLNSKSAIIPDHCNSRVPDMIYGWAKPLHLNALMYNLGRKWDES